MDKVFIYEEDGKFYLTDRYGLKTVRFADARTRKQWLDGFPGFSAEIIKGKPNVMEELSEGLDIDEATKKKIAKEVEE